MGKKHRNKRGIKSLTWSRVIIPKFIPPCPLCEKSRHVEQEEDEPIIFECSLCHLEFVCLDDGTLVDLDDLIRADGYTEKALKSRSKPSDGVYTLGLMVEDE